MHFVYTSWLSERTKYQLNTTRDINRGGHLFFVQLNYLSNYRTIELKKNVVSSEKTHDFTVKQVPITLIIDIKILVIIPFKIYIYTRSDCLILIFVIV